MCLPHAIQQWLPWIFRAIIPHFDGMIQLQKCGKGICRGECGERASRATAEYSRSEMLIMCVYANKFESESPAALSLLVAGMRGVVTQIVVDS